MGTYTLAKKCTGSIIPVAYSLDGAYVNQAESYFSRLRRGEIGQHHHISGGAALGHPISRVCAGYSQR
jgi:hypothetical protein